MVAPNAIVYDPTGPSWFAFVRLSAPNERADAMELVYQHAEMIQRPGVDGTAFLQVGKKGDPFQVESFVDVDSFSAGLSLKAAYKAIVGVNLYDVWVGNVSYYSAFSHKYFITDVSVRVASIGKSAGGLSTLGLARVDALWTMVPVYLGS